MERVRLTKNELRTQQMRLGQLVRYLPTLQLKKSMLQSELGATRSEILRLEKIFHDKRLEASASGMLLSTHFGIDFEEIAKVESIKKHYENLAGVEIPVFESVLFVPYQYSLFSTPAWLDPIMACLRAMVEAKAAVLVEQEKLAAIEKELKEIAIRVNLFEKNLIPKSQQIIKRIKVFLSDQELAAVGQAKVAKDKIEKKRLRAR